MALFHVLVWKAEPEPGEKREPVAKYMVEARNTADAIEKGTAMFATEHREKALKDHLVQGTPA